MTFFNNLFYANKCNLLRVKNSLYMELRYPKMANWLYPCIGKPVWVFLLISVGALLVATTPLGLVSLIIVRVFIRLSFVTRLT